MANPYDRRIRRAEELAQSHAPVREILGFYVQIARFQDGLHRRLSEASSRHQSSLRDPSAKPSAHPRLVLEFPEFLVHVEKRGPAPLASVVHEFRQRGAESWSDLLDSCWWAADTVPSRPQEFLARAFLQPYAEFLNSRAGLNLKGYSNSLCPYCNRKPGLAALRQQGDGAARWLICSFCLAEWEFRRIICPACGEENDRNLLVYTASGFDYIRVDCCETCKTYIKSVDLTKNGLAEPVVDEIAAAALDLWAQEHGYAKLQPNVVGM
jgi:formate dehydrogenase accessory protein FdhE